MKQNPKKIKYPIGVQSFRKIREENYFLSRPRRFGKSLLLSTLEAYYRGHRDLFNGLALESLADDWDPHPVLHLDLNNARYDSVENLNNLRDISFENQFDSICGITHEELTDYFKEGICQFASEYNIRRMKLSDG